MDIKRSIVKKPDRGSFPLDHSNECTSIKNNYLKCLKEHKNDHISCKKYSKEYFMCRIDNNLLEKQDLSNLGFYENELNNESRLKNFKNVYSYNAYKEKMEASKEKNKMKEYNDIKFDKKKNDIYHAKEIENKNEITRKDSNGFLNLQTIKNDVSDNNNIKENMPMEMNEKIAIKRKEESGYLAGKEYLKVLLEKKKKKSFLSSIFKSNNT
ncbi:cytochrome c oxidase assembly protein COX19, putative [Plasmodium berghei]|uniref:Cytochrome c oxidase assembly protein COX19, putative n=2 Tax=Plasmodium berghei TaxID=5821 RepID=A0A509AGR0_PLABA|nr:cytochrome c oxidase assembly protein COX19, putative [Plasmodium berghei ANKA]CXI14912.1 cytochrome c oxidase assembly protein COX19, putative [Plasmodium berghei]SCM19536.1 cytochrome c oxidase assembly protein COX19, putative [Plasmodium berghei]SCN23274.1 cytochrome c oxidase assembly protein COX19, putative [Plasmodium berghei]SCO58998.1 cytochrome c oxidase assembly protein COX19, putative [Plasmodium berghei]SCO59500.1 cytochrome c oxidase assembly protein COX19, putative [Plasmodium|eukprot:XP_034420509.1 cytochrome c oxidase assembly protein COX19, putative [Plasmodium berghei ANKA]